jgi:hypothetical protein
MTSHQEVSRRTRSRVGGGRSLRAYRAPRPLPNSPPPTGGRNGDPPSTRPSVPMNVLKIFGSLVGPATMLTALMFYFGLLHAYWFFGTFGVDYTIFNLTAQDYLIRSADGLFVPLTAVAATVLASFWIYRLLPAQFGRKWRRAAPIVIPVMATLGMAFLSIAVAGLVKPEILAGYLAVPGLSLTVGVAALAAASRMHRWLRQERADDEASVTEPLALLAAEWAAVFLLASVGLFWAAGDWSAAVGTRRGNQVLQALRDWPDAVLYSDNRLNISGAGVREIRCRTDDDQPGYRYDGLHLIVHAGEKYLFLPAEWNSSGGEAIVVPQTDTLRLVFTPHGASRNGRC